MLRRSLSFLSAGLLAATVLAGATGVSGASNLALSLTDAQRQCLVDAGVTVPTSWPTPEELAVLQAAATSCGITLPAPPAPGTGTISCRLVGRMIWTTPLASAGTTATTGTFRGKALGCSGTDGGAVVRTGTVTATVTLPANDCSALANPGAISLDGNVRWKTIAGNPAIADTSFTLGSLTADPLSLLKPLFAATGTTTVGSFSGQSLASTLSVSQAFAAIAKQCEGARFRGFTVRASQSTFVIGTPPV